MKTSYVQREGNMFAALNLRSQHLTQLQTVGPPVEAIFGNAKTFLETAPSRINNSVFSGRKCLGYFCYEKGSSIIFVLFDRSTTSKFVLTMRLVSSFESMLVIIFLRAIGSNQRLKIVRPFRIGARKLKQDINYVIMNGAPVTNYIRNGRYCAIGHIWHHH